MSEENIKKLYDKAQKYLKTANLLIEHEDFDSVISRTYYAMYYMVKSILLTKDIVRMISTLNNLRQIEIITPPNYYRRGLGIC